MPLASVATRNVKYKGCPPDCRHITFVRPDGNEMAAFLPIDPSWDVSVFVEDQFFRFFLVASSPNKQELRIERWLPNHGPERIVAATQAEQGAALGGKHAGNSTHAELADAAVASLTADDTPAAVPPRGTDLVAMTAPNPNGATQREKRGQYGFHTSEPEGQPAYLALRTIIEGPLSNKMLKTKGTEATLLAAFCNVDQRSAYYLFDQGANYTLEALDWWGGEYRRQEATAAKTAHPGSHEDAIKSMVPGLVPDQA